MQDVTLSNSLTDLAFRIRAEHDATASAMKRGIYHAMAAGDLLTEAKGLLKHGQWRPWLAEHCAIPERTASHYMRLARRRAEIGNVADLTVQGAITLLREADTRQEHHEAFCLVRDECQSIIKELEGHQQQPRTVELAEKHTEGLRWLMFWLWRLCEICLKLGEHKRLGLTEDEYYEQMFAQLPEGGVTQILREVFQAYRAETVDYGAL